MNIRDDHLDVIKEMINVGVGRAASALNQMVDSRIHLRVPEVRVLSTEEFLAELALLGRQRISAVRMRFSGSFAGSAALLFPPASAANLVATLAGDGADSSDLDSIRAGTLAEVGNILINSVMGSMSNFLDERLTFSLPVYLEDNLEVICRSGGEESARPTILLARTHFIIEQLQVEGDIHLRFDLGGFDRVLQSIDALIREESTNP
ncbi:MAG: chemotaxis protein CheC [Planctomycetota bacterium]